MCVGNETSNQYVQRNSITLQWNLFDMDTFGREESVLISKVSDVHKQDAWDSKVSCLLRRPM